MKIPEKIAIKIVYGYKPTDYVVVENLDEVAKAIYARTEKIPVTIGGRFISGQEIKQIVPDVHSYTGWYRSYEPSSADDFAQIERDVPKVIDELIALTSKRVEQLVTAQQENLIGRESLNPALLLSNKQHG